MATTYYLKNIRIWNYIDALIKTNITWLSDPKLGTNVTVSGLPAVYVVPTNDSLTLTSLSDAKYDLQPGYGIIFRNQATGNSETDMKMLVSGIGAIIDVLTPKAGTYDITTSGRVDAYRIEVEDIDFNYQSPGINPAVIYEGKINVRGYVEQ